MAIQTINYKDLPLNVRKTAASKALQKLKEAYNSAATPEHAAEIKTRIDQVVAWSADDLPIPEVVVEPPDITGV